MDEELINRIIKLKLDMTKKLIDQMPEKISSEIKDLGKTILKSINENIQEEMVQPCKKSKSADRLNHIKIE